MTYFNFNVAIQRFTSPALVMLREMWVNIYSICSVSDRDRASEHRCNLGDKLADIHFQSILTKEICHLDVKPAKSGLNHQQLAFGFTTNYCSVDESQRVNINIWCYQVSSYKPVNRLLRHILTLPDNLCWQSVQTKPLIKISPPAVRKSKSGVNWPHNPCKCP